MTDEESTRRKVYFAIAKYWEEEGTSPTIRCIRDRVGLASESTVLYHRDKLVEDGFLKLGGSGQAKILRPEGDKVPA